MQTVGFGCEDLHKVWYYNCIACLCLEKGEYLGELLEEYLMILKENDKQREYFAGVCQDFKAKILEVFYCETHDQRLFERYMNEFNINLK
jgi:hypothetical protein